MRPVRFIPPRECEVRVSRFSGQSASSFHAVFVQVPVLQLLSS